jgi:hypothetical protein
MELFAGRVHGALLFFRAVVDRRSSIFVDRFPQETFRGTLSQRGVVVQVTDDFAAQCPEVIDVLANGLGGEAGGRQMLNERPETEDQCFPRR